MKIGIIMGSGSDFPVLEPAYKLIRSHGVPCEIAVVSAHRDTASMIQFGVNAEEEGYSVIIAGAGGAAHLPGMIAALTTVPVIGVPVNSSNSILGVDSLLSIAQMPAGTPVATVGIDNAYNAGVLALEIVALIRPEIRLALKKLKQDATQKVAVQNETIKNLISEQYE